MLVLLCALSGIIESGVGELVRQTAFTLSDVVDEGAKLGAAPTAGGLGGAGSAKGQLLAAVALEVDCGRMPLVDLAKEPVRSSCAGVRPCSERLGSCCATFPSTGPARRAAPHLYHDLAPTRAPLLSNPQTPSAYPGWLYSGTT
jgi:hypothetical protein